MSLKLGKVGKGVDDKMNKLGLEFEDIEVTEKHLKQILSPHFRFNQWSDVPKLGEVFEKQEPILIGALLITKRFLINLVPVVDFLGKKVEEKVKKLEKFLVDRGHGMRKYKILLLLSGQDLM